MTLASLRPVLVALAVVVLAGSGTAAAAAAELQPAPTTWSVEPATAEGPDGRVSLRHTVDPGDDVVDYITVTNYGSRAATFLVYASDGLVTAGGDFDLLPSTERPVDGGSWIEIADPTAPGETASELRVELGPESSATIRLSIAVPEDASPGDHPAGIVAELVDGAGNAVDVVARVGVRAHLRVSGEVEPRLALTRVEAAFTPSWNPFAPGTLAVEYLVRNEGNVRLGAAIEVRAAGPFGWLEVSDDGEVREILPAQSRSSTATFEVWPLFSLWGDVTVEPVVVGDDLVEGELPTASASFSAVAVPWPSLVLLVVAAAVVVGALLLRRRLAARARAQFDAAVDARARELAGAGGDPGRSLEGGDTALEPEDADHPR